MCERVGMAPTTTGSTPGYRRHWWQRRGPSLFVLTVVLIVLGLTTMAVAGQVAKVLPEVGRDQLGEDRWDDPLGLELAGPFQIAHLPDCAAGAITRIVLWDAESNPYWEVVGAPKPLTTFAVGAPPEGFLELTPYREPPPGEVLRLVAFRRIGGATGIRYRTSQLKTERVVSGTALTAYTVEGFQVEPVCSDSPADTDEDLGPLETTVVDVGASTTTMPG